MSVIAAQRLVRQRLVESPFRTPAAVVAWLGGVQAQDYAGAKWSIGLRLPGSTDADVERAVAEGALVRTWAMRGTLHFLAAEDVRWLVSALAPGIIARNRRRYEQLGLASDVFARSNRAIEGALVGHKRLTRAELAQALEQTGIAAGGQRLPYFLQRASLDGVACHGPAHDGEPTFVLQHEWLPQGRPLNRDDALATLATRYFAGHGPATWRDFAWW